MCSSRLHDPLLGLGPVPGETADGLIVLDTQENVAAFQIEERDHLSRQFVLRDVVTFELDSGALAVADQFDQFSLVHGRPPTILFDGWGGNPQKPYFSLRVSNASLPPSRISSTISRTGRASIEPM